MSLWKRSTRTNARPMRTGPIAWPQVIYALLVCACMFAHLGGPLRLVFLGGGVALAWRLLRTDPAGYVSFILWLWFFTALVRRVADLYASWQDPSMILLTPYIVTSLSIVPFVERLLRERGRLHADQFPAGSSMFGLAAVGTALGIPFGFALWPYMALLESFNYLTPLILGWYISTQSEHLPAIEQAIVRTFRRCSVIVGAYGIYQYTTAPPWDTAWMMNSDMGSIGRPEPYMLRVFSTLHGPGVLGAFLAVALILWLAKPRVWDLPGAALAGVTLLLSSVRSAWLTLAIGGLLVLASLKPSQKIRVALLVGFAFVVTGPLLVTPEMAELFGARLATFEQLQDDKSGKARITGHEIAFDIALREPLGLGIGQTDMEMEGYIGMRDSTIVAGLIQFGFLGALCHFLALGMVCVRVWLYYWRSARPEGAALACAGCGLLAMMPLGVVSAGPVGILFWLVAGLAVADRQLARAHQARAVAPAPGAPPPPRQDWRNPVPA